MNTKIFAAASRFWPVFENSREDGSGLFFCGCADGHLCVLVDQGIIGSRCDYVTAKHVQFSAMQLIASWAKSGDIDPNEERRVEVSSVSNQAMFVGVRPEKYKFSRLFAREAYFSCKQEETL